MGNKKKKEQHKVTPKVVEVEFKISMYCEGCEKQVAKAISKIKGVEEFMTDMNKHKVVVKGRINADTVLKKLKKKTGKRVEMVTKKEDNKKKGEEKEEDLSSFEAINPKQVADALILEFTGDSMLYTMFSDENANACSIIDSESCDLMLLPEASRERRLGTAIEVTLARLFENVNGCVSNPVKAM